MQRHALSRSGKLPVIKLHLNCQLTASQSTERRWHHSVPYRRTLLTSNSIRDWSSGGVALVNCSPQFSFCRAQWCNELRRLACLYCLIAKADFCPEEEQSAINFSWKRLEHSHGHFYTLARGVGPETEPKLLIKGRRDRVQRAASLISLLLLLSLSRSFSLFPL